MPFSRPVTLGCAVAQVCVLLSACSASKPIERPSPPPTSVVEKPAPPREAVLYGVDEALRDVLSSELVHVGTGRWPGIERSPACVFRNARVLVVDAYCTPTEAPAFHLDVYSPERGRARLYAESNGPFSVRDRALYFTFLAYTEPPPSAEARIGPPSLTMSFDALRSYEQARYDALLPSCYTGERHRQAIDGCLGALAPKRAAWSAQNRDFIARASSDWYRVVRLMRELSLRFGRDIGAPSAKPR